MPRILHLLLKTSLRKLNPHRRAMQLFRHPKLSFEDVRGILADIARAGNREGVKALLEKYGASKLSALAPEHYAAILKDAEGLKNA